MYVYNKKKYCELLRERNVFHNILPKRKAASIFLDLLAEQNYLHIVSFNIIFFLTNITTATKKTKLGKNVKKTMKIFV